MEISRPVAIGALSLFVVGGICVGFLQGKSGGDTASILDSSRHDKLVTPVSLTRSVTTAGDKYLSPAATPRLSPGVTKSPALSPVTLVVTPWPSTAIIRSQATPTPSFIQAPTPWPTTTPSSSVVPSPTPIATSTPESTVAVSPTPEGTRVGAVVINEIGWMGTDHSSTDEWLELFNPGSAPVDLAGWHIGIAGDNAISISGIMGAGEYYLLERTDDTVIKDITADYAGPFGRYGLNDAGEHLTLKNASGIIVDDVDCSGGWYAGTTGKGLRASMERMTSGGGSSDASSWATNSGAVLVGADAGGTPIHGTPRYRNSVSP